MKNLQHLLGKLYVTLHTQAEMAHQKREYSIPGRGIVIQTQSLIKLHFSPN